MLTASVITSGLTTRKPGILSSTPIMIKATNVIYHDKAHPSALILLVVP